MQSRALGLGMVIVACLALIASVTAGTPDPLPDIALDSEALFHLERTLVFVVVILVLVRIVERAWHGELPVEFSTTGLKYTVKEVRDETEESLEALYEEAANARQERDEILARLRALEE